MIYLIGEYSVFNRDAAILGVKSLFDKKGVDCEIITPSMDVKHQRNRAALTSGFDVGTVWSIYDRFTGRVTQEELRLTPENYQAPPGYQAQSGQGSLKYLNGESTLDLKLRADGSIESIEHIEAGDLIDRFNYDDGGHLITVEYPLGNDTHTKIVDAQGEPIFELYQTGKYKKVVKIKYLPMDLDFLSEAMFWEWAFERLVEAKDSEDKFFIMNESFRRAIATSDFKKSDVYLLPMQTFDESFSRDILYDHYEKIIFNGHDEMKLVGKAFEDRTSSKLYWNNYISTDKIAANYGVDTFSVYLNLGTESELVDFNDVTAFVLETLKSEEQVSFMIEFSLLRDQVNLLDRFRASGVDEEMIQNRLQVMTRPLPEIRSAAMASSILYIHYQNPAMVSSPLMLAIAAEKPILALEGDPLLNDYLSDSNGKIISDTSVSRLIRQTIYDVEFIQYLAPELGIVRENFSDENTMRRWDQIFSDKGQKL
ncbi:MAG: hypothetical protein ACK5LM_02760 [Lactovum sp.]